MTNTEKTIKNSIICVIAQIATLLLQFINRRVFIIFLDIEFLGYQTLFSNVFSLLSIAELGIGNIIAFHLYKEIVNKNNTEIGKLMYLYKWLYRIVAAVVLIAGIVCFFLLPYFVKDVRVEWSYLQLIYVLQLASVVIGYFLSYRRTILIASQQEYKCVQTDLYVNVVVQILQLGFLALFHDYLLYLIMQLSTTIIANVIIYRKTNKEYPFLEYKYTVTKEDIDKRNIFSDLKNFLIHQICYAVYGATDNIIISAFCGVRNVALYGNYVLIQRGVMQVLFYRLLNPVQATIGNIVHSGRSKTELWHQFKVLDVFSFFFATYIGLGFLVFYQPCISLWMGTEYLLSDMFVLLFSVTIYLGAVWEIVYKYRTAFGDYKQDRNFMITSAILNLSISIPGAMYYGIEGIQFGTLVAFLPIAFGRIRFVVQNYFEQSMYKYIFKHGLLLIVFIIEGVVAYNLTYALSLSLFDIFIRILVWLIVPFVINTLIYMRNSYYKEMLNKVYDIVGLLLSKIKR